MRCENNKMRTWRTFPNFETNKLVQTTHHHAANNNYRLNQIMLQYEKLGQTKPIEPH